MSRLGVAAGVGALMLLFGVVAFESVVRRAENYSYYPDYSSLNNEDTGLKAYYETLVRLGVSVSRNYRPFLKLEGQKATVVYAGPNLGDFRSRSEKDLEQFERIAQGGARVLILFQTKETRYEKIAQLKPETKPSGKEIPQDEMKPRADTMLKRWGVEEAEAEVAKPQRPTGAAALTPSIVRRDVLWHFAKWDPRWKPVRLGSDGNPLLLERSFGQGSIGLLAAVEPFTNHQLLTKPDALAGKELADVVLVDVVEGVPQGKGLDIAAIGSRRGLRRGNHRREQLRADRKFRRCHHDRRLSAQARHEPRRPPAGQLRDRQERYRASRQVLAERDSDPGHQSARRHVLGRLSGIQVLAQPSHRHGRRPGHRPLSHVPFDRTCPAASRVRGSASPWRKKSPPTMPEPSPTNRAKTAAAVSPLKFRSTANPHEKAYTDC